MSFEKAAEIRRVSELVLDDRVSERILAVKYPADPHIAVESHALGVRGDITLNGLFVDAQISGGSLACANEISRMKQYLWLKDACFVSVSFGTAPEQITAMEERMREENMTARLVLTSLFPELPVASIESLFGENAVQRLTYASALLGIQRKLGGLYGAASDLAETIVLLEDVVDVPKDFRWFGAGGSTEGTPYGDKVRGTLRFSEMGRLGITAVIGQAVFNADPRGDVDRMLRIIDAYDSGR